MIEKLGNKVKEGLNIKAVATSRASEELARSLGINIVKINQVQQIDLTIDGADEFDKNLNGIKGGGGALLYEKIVATNSRMNIWITDSSKFVERLGRFPLPIEVVPFGSEKVFERLQKEGLNPKFRKKNNSYFVTDGKHYIIDLYLKKIDDPYELHKKLISFTGIIETGLFLDIADIVIMGSSEGCKIWNK